MYESDPVRSVGFAVDRRPPAARYIVFGATAFGGHDAKVRQRFAPVSNAATFGSGAPHLSFSWHMKNGKPMLSRKNWPGLLSNLRTPSESSPPRFQEPCVHGPMTNVRVVDALISSSDW